MSATTHKRFRSGLEQRIAGQLERAHVPVQYEATTLPYTVPSRVHRYTPDFTLPGSNILVEAKGLFTVADRQKMLLVKAQHPELDFRLVFSNANSLLYKGSSTTYAQWCEQNGFLYASKAIPAEWLLKTELPSEVPDPVARPLLQALKPSAEVGPLSAQGGQLTEHHTLLVAAGNEVVE